MQTMILTRNDIIELMDMKSVIEAVENVFKDLKAEEAGMPPKSYINLNRGDFRAMPAFVPGGAGIKWVNVHPGNRETGLPTVMAVLIYNDPYTGYPLAIMDATEITAYRTGAAAAIASKHLARADSSRLGLFGAGYQALTQIMAHCELFNLDRIKVYDIKKEAVDKLAELFPKHRIEYSTLEETAKSDIICTLTPSRKPFLFINHIANGTHINAVGADAKGKQELDVAVLKNAKVVVDDIAQASSSGEINVPISKGEYSLNDVYSTLGDIINGEKTGRNGNNEITVFDSTGIAVEDIAVAKLVYDRVHNNNKYKSVNLVP